MKAKALIIGLAIVIGVLILGFILPRFSSTRLDAAEIRCSHNLKSIAAAAQRFWAQSNRLPPDLCSLEAFGLSIAETNCPAAPPNYIVDPTGTNFVVCPNHRIQAGGSAFRITSNLDVHTPGTSAVESTVR